MRIVRLADVRPQPWANGAGETRELWSLQGEAGPDLRISIATLAGPAPFSRLPGMARSFMPIDDVDAVLSIDGGILAPRRHAVLPFHGDADTRLVSLGRAGRVLNIFSRAAGWHHEVTIGEGTIPAAGFAVALADGAAGGHQLAAGDLLEPDGEAAIAADMPMAFIHFQPAQKR